MVADRTDAPLEHADQGSFGEEPHVHDFEVKILFEPDAAVMRLQGRLDRETSSILSLVTETLVDATSCIVFDFADIGVVDDFGVDGLERCMRLAADRGLRVAFRNTRRSAMSITSRYGIEEHTAPEGVRQELVEPSAVRFRP